MQLNISVTILLYILFINVATFNGQDVVNSIDEEKLFDKRSIDAKSKEGVVVIEVPLMDPKDLKAISRIGVATALSVGGGLLEGTRLLIKWIKGKHKG